MHFVLVVFSAIWFLQHHPETSFILCCKSLRISSTLSLSVLMVPSSANKLHWTHARVRYRGRCKTKAGLGSTLEALYLLQTFHGSMCHLQIHIVDDPVSNIVENLYLRCLYVDVFSVKYRDEPCQTPCVNREIQYLTSDECWKRRAKYQLNG